MTTLNITITTNNSDASVYATATHGRKCVANIVNLLHGLTSGMLPGTVVVQRSANDPVRAFGTLTVVYATIANAATVVIGGTTLTCVTGTPSGYTQFKKEVDLATTIANLAAAINGNTTLNKLVSAAVTATGVVTITSLTPGVVGNQITLVGGTGATASGANFTTGAGGCESTVVTLRG